MSLKGSLDDLPLPDIIQLVSMSGKTGAFSLESQTQAGEIFLRDGQMVHAHLGKLRGEDAVYEFAVWQAGNFEFQEGRETEEQSIQRSSTSLLMAAARRIEEWQVLSKRIPSTQLVPVLTGQSWPSSVSFSPQEWAVICKIDGSRSIDDIAEALDLGAFDVAKLLYGLVTSGLLELQEAADRPSPFSAKLQQMSRSELEISARRVHVQAMMQLAGHGETAEVEALSSATLSKIQSGHGVEAVAELIKSVEEVIASALGPVHGSAFAQQVGEQLRADS